LNTPKLRNWEEIWLL